MKQIAVGKVEMDTSGLITRDGRLLRCMKRKNYLKRMAQFCFSLMGAGFCQLRAFLVFHVISKKLLFRHSYLFLEQFIVYVDTIQVFCVHSNEKISIIL